MFKEQAASEEPRPLRREDLLHEGDVIRELKVPQLGALGHQPARAESSLRQLCGSALRFLGPEASCSQAFCQGPGRGAAAQERLLMPRAGPRQWLHWDPQEVRAVIVNCGGLCPGLNAVIRELVVMLHVYGCTEVWGVVAGYKGVTNPDCWRRLTPDGVRSIHLRGGSVLVADRGNPPHREMAEVLASRGINQLYIIGGDGSQKGAMQIYDEAEKMGYRVSICGVPKTIDNDIALLDCTFGFHTAVSEAVRAIDAAYTEACGNTNCIGLVKLMGRHAGFIALHATLAARHVDLCLLPEMDIDMERCLEYIVEAQSRKGRGVVVVIAEGLGDTLLQGEGRDAGGNKILADVGPWFKRQVEARFAELDLPLSIKYIDPSYMIRAAPPDTFDSVYCATLAQNAVHGAMAGYTAFCVGQVDGNQVMLPIPSVTRRPARVVDVHGEDFAMMVLTTKQPVLAASADDCSAEERRNGPALGVENALRRFESPVHAFPGALAQTGSFRRCLVDNLSACAPSPASQTPLRNPNVDHKFRIFHTDDSWCTHAVHISGECRLGATGCRENLQMLRAGPREMLHWKPERVKAVIVNCGGICPGVNSVIRELVMMLHLYGCQEVWGVHGGFEGVTEPSEWLPLTPEVVKEVHLEGGCLLRTGRGNPPHAEMARVYAEEGVNQVYIIGGFGSHQGAQQTYDEARILGHEVSVCGIPKTIDNDMALLDFTFGHNTAVAEAKRAIDAAYLEARDSTNCVGLVKLMGRHAGFIALHATLAARHVDLCVIPEMDFDVERCFDYVVDKQEHKKRGVVVVIAEGLKDVLFHPQTAGDEDVGQWFRRRLEEHAKQRGSPLRVKYIDPFYMIRTASPDPIDSIYCAALAQNAVHGAMAGYSGFTVGKVDNNYVMLPIREIVARERRTANPTGRWFARLMCTTMQPPGVAGAPEDAAVTGAGAVGAAAAHGAARPHGLVAAAGALPRRGAPPPRRTRRLTGLRAVAVPSACGDRSGGHCPGPVTRAVLVLAAGAAAWRAAVASAAGPHHTPAAAAAPGEVAPRLGVRPLAVLVEGSWSVSRRTAPLVSYISGAAIAHLT